MAFRWRADDWSILVVFGSTHWLKKNEKKFDPLWKIILDPRIVKYSKSSILELKVHLGLGIMDAKHIWALQSLVKLWPKVVLNISKPYIKEI